MVSDRIILDNPFEKAVSKAILKSPSQNALSQSQGGHTSRRTKKVDYTKDYKIKLWEEMQMSYIRDSMKALG